MSEDKQLYQCPECGLHYTNEEIAKKCEAFCKEHMACSLEITQYSVEAQGRQSFELDETI